MPVPGYKALIMKCRTILFLVIFSCPVFILKGQSAFLSKLFSDSHDSSYITSYSTDFTTRFFSLIKNNQMGYKDNMVGKSLLYKPNKRMLFGVGVNHGNMGKQNFTTLR
jgi:hypothetical protein